jgi:hypothetical protein
VWKGAANLAEAGLEGDGRVWGASRIFLKMVQLRSGTVDTKELAG